MRKKLPKYYTDICQRIYFVLSFPSTHPRTPLALFFPDLQKPTYDPKYANDNAGILNIYLNPLYRAICSHKLEPFLLQSMVIRNTRRTSCLRLIILS